MLREERRTYTELWYNNNDELLVLVVGVKENGKAQEYLDTNAPFFLLSRQ